MSHLCFSAVDAAASVYAEWSVGILSHKADRQRREKERYEWRLIVSICTSKTAVKTARLKLQALYLVTLKPLLDRSTFQEVCMHA